MTPTSLDREMKTKEVVLIKEYVKPYESTRERYKRSVHPRLSLVTAVDALCLKVLT